MLDENLPTFIVEPPSARSKAESTIHYTQFGNERTPAYTLKRPDPTLPGSKNRYALALYDSFNPEVLYAEILLIPEWTRPTLSAEQIRLNGGVPPAPEPILPNEFTIQLYNPDQQVVVRQKKAGTFSSTPTWYFDMPQQTFRQPSSSVIDRTQDDPSVASATPKIAFKWKKDSKFSKDLVCFLSGKTVNPDGTKKKSKEPDITVGIFQHFRELTMYEPNMQRIDLEDWKGFEVVLLLGAVAIRDVYFGQLEETFNISGGPKPTSNGTSTAASKPTSHNAIPSGRANGPTPKPTSPPQGSRPPRVPPTDPRSQWELDAETARLKKQTEAEERQRAKREAEEQRRIRHMLEAEEKEKRRKQAEIDKETERLKRLYGKEQAQAEASLRLPKPSSGRHGHQRHSAPQVPTVTVAHHPSPSPAPYNQRPQQYPSFAPMPGSFQPYVGGPYLSGARPAASQSTFFAQPSSSSSSYRPQHNQKLKEKKSSFFGFRERTRSGGFDGEDSGFPRLMKKKSSLF